MRFFIKAHKQIDFYNLFNSLFLHEIEKYKGVGSQPLIISNEEDGIININPEFWSNIILEKKIKFTQMAEAQT